MLERELSEKKFRKLQSQINHEYEVQRKREED
jgi:hypothetical protein